jgi:hypothetical protein
LAFCFARAGYERSQSTWTAGKFTAGFGVDLNDLKSIAHRRKCDSGFLSPSLPIMEIPSTSNSLTASQELRLPLAVHTVLNG